MPLDPIFKSDWKPRRPDGKKRPRLELQINEESVEMQLGRSDFFLGEPISKNPFPENSHDGAEWTKGWLAQKARESHNPLSSPSKPIKTRRSPSSASA